MKASVLILPAVCLAVVGCGKGTFYSGPAGEVNPSNASTIKSNLQTAAVMSFGKPGELPAPTRTDYSACTTMVPALADQVDANANGIKKELTRTYACNNLSRNEGDRALTYGLNGTFKEQDRNDAVPASSGFAGFRFDIDFILTLQDTSDATKNTVHAYKGFWDFDKRDTKLLYTSNFQGTGSFQNKVGRGVGYTYTYGSSWNHELTPDASDYHKGSMKFGGYWGFEVNVSARAQANFKVVLEASGEVTYDSTCTLFYKTGTTTFKAAKGTLTYDWNCTTVAVKLDGTPVT